MAESAEVLDGGVEAARLVDNVQGLAWNLFNRSFAAFAAGDIDARARHRRGERRHRRRISTTARALGTQPCARGTRCSRPAAPSRPPSCSWRRRRRGAAADRRRLARAVPRAADALPARAGQARGSRARRRRGAGVRRDGRTADGRRDGRARRAALDLDAGDAARAAERALERRGLLEGSGDRFDAAMARLLAGRALAQAGEPDRPRPSSSARRRRSTRSARPVTAPRRNASCESSGAASTVARGPGRPTEPESRRSRTRARGGAARRRP